MEKKKWTLDPTHSEISFKIKHLMIATVTGYFRNFSVNVITPEDDWSKMEEMEFSAEVDSIDTNNVQRDQHLRSPEFFNSKLYSKVIFAGAGYDGNKQSGKLSGILTMHGISHPVIFDVEFGGVVIDNYGQTKLGFTIQGKLSRKKFGLTWDHLTEAGNVVVSDEVKLFGDIQLIQENLT